MASLLCTIFILPLIPLVRRQRLPERRRLRAEELSAGIRFHDRDPDSLRLAAAVKLHTLTGAASCEVAVLIIVSRIDREHQLVRDPRIQHLCGKRRSMGGIENISWSAIPVSSTCAASAGVWEDSPICLTTPFFFISCR